MVPCCVWQWCGRLVKESKVSILVFTCLNLGGVHFLVSKSPAWWRRPCHVHRHCWQLVWCPWSSPMAPPNQQIAFLLESPDWSFDNRPFWVLWCNKHKNVNESVSIRYYWILSNPTVDYVRISEYLLLMIRVLPGDDQVMCWWSECLLIIFWAV